MGIKTSFYISDEIRKKLRLTPERGLGRAVSQTIDRYHAIIHAESERLTEIFTKDEWETIRGACAYSNWATAGLIRNGVLAEVQDMPDSKLGGDKADRKTLEKKLGGLTVTQQFALVEMIEGLQDRK
jgi:hypothetical protein